MAITDTWNSNFEELPETNESLEYGDDKLRQLKRAVRERLEREHISGVAETNNDHGWHRPGSGLCYAQSTVPVYLPDGVTELADDTLSKGRLWIDTDTGVLYCWDGTAWTALYAGSTIELVKIIGNWNMDSTASVSVAHGLSTAYKNIRSMTGIIRNDADSLYYPFLTANASTGDAQMWVSSIGATNIGLNRLASGMFDSLDFDTAVYNRGWIYIRYASS